MADSARRTTPSWTSRRVRPSAVAVSVVAVVALASCGSAESIRTPHGVSSDASAGSSSDAPPAEVRAITVNGAQLQVPSNWSVEGGGTQRATLSTPKNASGTSTGTGIFNADITLAEDTEALAEVLANVAGRDGERLPDVKFGGQTFFHYRELHGGVDSLDTYGTVLDGSEVTVAWGFNAKLTTREQIDGYINQVMPTFKFNG